MIYKLKSKWTSVQLYQETKRRLEKKKLHRQESYDAVIRRILERDTLPSMEEMFQEGDFLKEKKGCSTEEVIVLSHQVRGKKWLHS